MNAPKNNRQSFSRTFRIGVVVCFWLASAFVAYLGYSDLSQPDRPPDERDIILSQSQSQAIDRLGHLVWGEKTAKYRAFEFGDYECEPCRSLQDQVESMESQCDQKASFTFIYLPLTKLHPHAFSAALASESAGAFGKFPKMHKLLYKCDMTGDFGLMCADALHIDPTKFEVIRKRKDTVLMVQESLDLDSELGISSTPTFAILCDNNKLKTFSNFGSFKRSLEESE